VIVTAERLASLASQVAMVDGGFDPLHPGHVAYFRAAAELDAPVLCCVASDDWVARKHPPLLTQDQRVELIDAIRYVDYTYASPSTTEDVLRALRPRYYVKGADWRGRLPAIQEEICKNAGTQIVFLDTVFDSSTAILRNYQERHERLQRLARP
jgi:cytidyltransferase-like protein